MNARVELSMVNATGEPSLEHVRLMVKRLLASPVFNKAPRMSDLLTFLVEKKICGKEHELTEYAIGLNVFRRDACAALAPNLGKLASALESARRVLAQLHDGAAQALPSDQPPQEDASSFGNNADASAAMPDADRPDAIDRDMKGGLFWRNRTQAYATLEMLADYLAEVEPHSPTPFLIRRAVNWGRMSLPEVIAEIIREEGDINRLFNVLGVRQ